MIYENLALNKLTLAPSQLHKYYFVQFSAKFVVTPDYIFSKFQKIELSYDFTLEKVIHNFIFLCSENSPSPQKNYFLTFSRLD